MPSARSTTSVSRNTWKSSSPLLAYSAGIRSARSPAYFVSSNAPLRHHQKPSGLVCMAATICLLVSFWLPRTRTPEIARRFPSSTRNTSRSLLSAVTVLSGFTRARKNPSSRYVESRRATTPATFDGSIGDPTTRSTLLLIDPRSRAEPATSTDSSTGRSRTVNTTAARRGEPTVSHATRTSSKSPVA